MEYKIYKLTFPNGVHFGKNSLESTQYVFQADTFFSSLCIEAIHRGEESLERLLAYVKQDKLAFSDALPYIGKEYYIPKPMLHIENNNQGDSVIKKAFKKMAFVPFSPPSMIDEILAGLSALWIRSWVLLVHWRTSMFSLRSSRTIPMIREPFTPIHAPIGSILSSYDSTATFRGVKPCLGSSF